MKYRYLVIIFLFYFFALLQNSFFVHFNISGSVPNLVFILFFLLVFFGKHNGYLKNFRQVIFLGALAGFFIDIFSYTYIGPSIILLIVIGFLAKRIQLLLKIRDDRFPFIYFAPIFLLSFIAYELLLMAYLHLFNFSPPLAVFDLRFLVEIVYNLFFAATGFLIFKKYVKKIQG